MFDPLIVGNVHAPQGFTLELLEDTPLKNAFVITVMWRFSEMEIRENSLIVVPYRVRKKKVRDYYPYLYSRNILCLASINIDKKKKVSFYTSCYIDRLINLPK